MSLLQYATCRSQSVKGCDHCNHYSSHLATLEAPQHIETQRSQGQFDLATTSNVHTQQESVKSQSKHVIPTPLSSAAIDTITPCLHSLQNISV